jgi:hypothetical protein
LKLCRSSKKKADSSRRPQFQKSCITVSAYHSSSSWQVGNEMLSCAAAARVPGPFVLEAKQTKIKEKHAQKSLVMCV